LLAEHAYDVGDLLFIDNEGMRVKKIDLMYTVLIKSSTGGRAAAARLRSGRPRPLHRAGRGRAAALLAQCQPLASRHAAPKSHPTRPSAHLPTCPPARPGEIVHYPLSKLITVPIINISRSANRSDKVG
jgi:hypothetical protein